MSSSSMLASLASSVVEAILGGGGGVSIRHEAFIRGARLIQTLYQTRGVFFWERVFIRSFTVPSLYPRLGSLC